MNPVDSNQSIRAIVEAQIQLPAVVAIISVTDADGTGRVAEALGRAFAQKGRNALLVRATGVLSDDDERPPLDTVQLAPGNDIGARVRLLRTGRDVVVVDAGPIEHASALEIVREADGVLIAVRLGRGIRYEDEQLGALLSRLNAKLLGAVTTGPGGNRPGRIAASRVVASHGFPRTQP